MSSILLEQWKILILVPLVVSIAANLLTPFVQRIIISFFASAAKSGNKALNGIVILRILQIDTEINEIERLTSDPSEILKHYRSTLVFVSFGLWLLLLSPVIAVCVQGLAVNYGHYLPGQIGQVMSIPGVAFAMTIGGLFAAGPFQAAIYSSYIGRRLKKIAASPSKVIEKLNKERSLLSEALKNSYENSNN